MQDVWGDVSEEECTEIANCILDLYEDVHDWNSEAAAATGQPDAKKQRS